MNGMLILWQGIPPAQEEAMKAWKVVPVVFWLALPASLASGQEEAAGSKVPEGIVEQLVEDGYAYELEVDAAGRVSNLEAHPVELNRGGEPELRVHGLGIRLCGAANCPTWIFQKDEDGYRLLLDVGSINRIEPQGSYTKGYRDLMAVLHGSAWESDLTLYKFDGEGYRRDSCYFRTYQYEDEHGTLREWKKPRVTRVECGAEECC
jgi:hypothetical protein